MLNALIIDDEAPSRQELAALLADFPNIKIVGQCENALEGLAAIHRQHPDLVFLDIEMPRVNGFEMLAMIEPSVMPRIIFVSAYDAYLLRAFEEHATDYLLKPVDKMRLAKTLDYLQSDEAATRTKALIPAQLTRIPCLAQQVSQKRIVLIPVEDIEYAYSDALGNHMVSATREGITELSLKILQQKTPLLFCHRQYLIHPAKVAEIILLENGAGEILTQSGFRLPVSRRYLRTITEHLCAS